MENPNDEQNVSYEDMLVLLAELTKKIKRYPKPEKDAVTIISFVFKGGQEHFYSCGINANSDHEVQIMGFLIERMFGRIVGNGTASNAETAIDPEQMTANEQAIRNLLGLPGGNA